MRERELERRLGRLTLELVRMKDQIRKLAEFVIKQDAIIERLRQEIEDTE